MVGVNRALVRIRHSSLNEDSGHNIFEKEILIKQKIKRIYRASQVSVRIRHPGWTRLRGRYTNNNDFKKVWTTCVLKQPCDDFYIHDEFLLKSGKLCLPHTSLREKVIRDLHGGGLAGYLRRDKAIASIKDIYYFPKLRRNLTTIVSRCYVCQRAKGQT